MRSLVISIWPCSFQWANFYEEIMVKPTRHVIWQLIFLLLIVSPGISGESKNIRVGQMGQEIQELKNQVRELSQPQFTNKNNALDIPSLKIRGFADTQYEANEDDNNFTLGDMDLFITSEVARNLKFFTEVVVEFESSGETVIDLERYVIEYEYADWLHISAGRGHTAIGYWNHTFHHGKWLYTTTDRPAIFEFEDKGGILPVHFVGIAVEGNLQFDFGNLSYMTNLANGRDRVHTKVQRIKDANDSKQVSMMFTLEPDFARGLGVGANVLFDSIPNNPAVGRFDSTQEAIAGFHLFYIDNKVEFITEFQHIDHSSIADFSHNGGYVQVAHRFGKFKPYYRFDFLNIDPHDSYFADKEDLDRHTFGIRYDWKTFAAIKLEYRHSETDSKSNNWGTVQIAFAF
jgi:hypothetical protein